MLRRGKYSLLQRLWRIVTLALVLLVGIWVYRKCTRTSEADKWKIASSPIQVIEIKKIAELAVISMEDEFVLDTVEYYTSTKRAWAGNTVKIKQRKNIEDVIQNAGVKRRLSLVIKTKTKVGFDLKTDHLQIFQNKDSVWIHTSQPKILALEINPSKTKVFIENGSWSDTDRKKLLKRIPLKIEKRLKENQLKEQINNTFDQLIQTLIQDERTILVYHDL